MKPSKVTIFDQFGRPAETGKPRVFGFTSTPVNEDAHTPSADAIASTVLYPIDEVYEL